MEVGEHLTNVLLINDFSSIRYYYLEFHSSPAGSEQPSLFDIETSLRSLGALVVTYRSGIWIFGRSSDTRPILPSTFTFPEPGIIKFDGHNLSIKEQGIYEPGNFWKILGPFTTSTPSPAFPTDNIIRNAQILNSKAVANNAGSGSSKENTPASSKTRSGPLARESTSSDRDIQEYFTSAVLATLSYHLCSNDGFVALNARTLLVFSPGVSSGDEKRVLGLGRSESTGQRICLVTLDVHLSSLGTLILKAWTDEPCKFDNLPISKEQYGSDIYSVEGVAVFLAPSGKVGRYAGTALDDAFISVTKNVGPAGEHNATRSVILGEPIATWKQRCINWLDRKGIKLSEAGYSHWVLVEILARTKSIGYIDGGEEGLWTPGERVITVAWPASLCFQRRTSRVAHTSSSGVGHGYDPLSFAEEWFTANANREAIIAKRQKERDSAAAATKAQTEREAKYLAPTSYSPMALRRASIAGAVYPTPPDGVQPHVGATPSFDDCISTPGQPIPQSVPVDADNLTVPKADIDETESSLWDANVVRKDQQNSGLDFNDSGNDNIFVDMGGDLFGEDDITDADFNFFDEPDKVSDIQEDPQENDTTMLEDIYEPGNAVEDVQGDSSNDAGASGAGTDAAVMGDAGGDENMMMQNSTLPVLTPQPQINLNHSEPLLSVAAPKTSSPPLSPELVFKRLSIAAGDEFFGSKKGTVSMRTVSAFGGVDFDPSFSSFSKKYGAHGRFIYPPTSHALPSTALTDIPMTDYLSKRLKRNPAPFNLLNQIFVLPEEHLLPELENNDSQSDVETPSYSHIASPISDQDDTSFVADDVPVVLQSSLKRKRGPEREISEDILSPSLQDLEVENHPQTSEPQELLDLALFDPDSAEWSLASFLSTPEPCTAPSSFTDEQYVASAQVLADQAISRTLSLPLLTNTDWSGCSLEQKIGRSDISTFVQRNLAKAARLSFDQVNECTMATFVEIQDLQAASQLSRLSSRPMPNQRGLQNLELTKPTTIFSLPPPHLEVRRAESKLTVLPPAIAFWESLGLAPSTNSKDVSAICVYPNAAGMVDNIDAFLDQMRSAYESNRLGSHERFSAGDLKNGHVAIDLGDTTPLSVADHQAVLLKIKETSTRLGTILVAGAAIETNIVLYYIYDSNIPELILPICSAFHDLFRVYQDILKERKLPVLNEIVLQLIPLDLLASQTSLVVPPPSEYARIAWEVYDRCIDLQSGTSTPSIVLEQPLPKTIDFKQTSNPSASPLQDNSCIHIAYAQSVDDRWVTASWTDGTGAQQMTASYCLGRRGVPLTTSFFTVAKEIWETTTDLIANRKISWRFMIAKCGVMEPTEIEFWKELAANSNDSTTQITLTLITVDTNPSLQLLPPSISIPPAPLAAQSFYTTPVSTPSASIVSPEQSGNAHTPSRESGIASAPTPTDSNTELKIDTDAFLVDFTDQSWGAILSHRLNNSRSLLEFNPTLMSGYLIKRSGTAPSDAPIVIEVNIVHSDLNCRMHEALLREILGYYRGFATLARVRGVVDPVKDGRPWHVAAAEKAVRVLYMLM